MGGEGGRSIPLELKRKVGGVCWVSPDGNKITSLLALERRAFPSSSSSSFFFRLVASCAPCNFRN